LSKDPQIYCQTVSDLIKHASPRKKRLFSVMGVNARPSAEHEVGKAIMEEVSNLKFEKQSKEIRMKRWLLLSILAKKESVRSTSMAFGCHRKTVLSSLII